MIIQWAGSTETRETRARNLLGLETCKYTRRYGQTGEDNEKKDHLAIMPSYEHGIYAAIDLIRDVYLKLGMFAVTPFGNKWAGDPKKIYGVNLARIMRVPGFLPLPFRLQGDALMKACSIMENGDFTRNIPPGYFGQYINEDL